MSGNDGIKNVDGYRLVKKIGYGGMGQVWHAKDPNGMDVAFKLIHPALCNDNNTFERIRREVSILSKLDHHNIVPLLDYELNTDTPFIVTELVTGLTLFDYVNKFGVMSVGQVLDFSKQMYDTLLYLRSINVVHRDLKPSNIIISDRPVLIDFGIAQKYYDDRITCTGLVAGTLGYLAPEVLAGKDPCFESDLWSLVALVGFALTAKNPFAAKDWSAVLSKMQKIDVCYDESNLPKSLLFVLCGCLNADISKRLPFELLLDVLSDLDKDISDSFICKKLEDYLGVEVFRSMYNSDSVAKYDIENDRVSMGDSGLVYGQEKNYTDNYNAGNDFDEFSNSHVTNVLPKEDATDFLVSQNSPNDGNTVSYRLQSNDVGSDHTSFEDILDNSNCSNATLGEGGVKTYAGNYYDNGLGNKVVQNAFDRDRCEGNFDYCFDDVNSDLQESVSAKNSFFSMPTLYALFSCIFLSFIYAVVLFRDFGSNGYAFNVVVIGVSVLILFFISYLGNYYHNKKFYRFFGNLLRSPVYFLKSCFNTVLFLFISYFSLVCFKYFTSSFFTYEFLYLDMLLEKSNESVLGAFISFLVACFLGRIFIAIRRIFSVLDISFSHFLVSCSLILVVVGNDCVSLMVKYKSIYFTF